MARRLDERRICLGVFILSVLLNLGFCSVGLRNSLMEIHEFRQLQTAYSTRYIQSEGFSVAYPTPLFGPPWSAPMEFPLFQVCVAQFAKITGLALEPAGRLVALMFLYVGLPAWFGLAGFFALKPHRRWLFLSLILLSPAYLYYSRSFLIESTALTVSAWFLLGYCRAIGQRSARWLTVAILFGIAAALTKVTTLIVFLIVAAAYTLHVLWQQSRNPAERRGFAGTIILALASTVPAVAAGTVWVRFTDTVKLTNPLAAELISERLWSFNFGTWAQRLSGEFWQRTLLHTSMAVMPAINLSLIVFIAVVLGRSTRRAALLLILGFLAGPLTFANLYFVHDYYFYASGVFLLGALCLAWNQLLDLGQFSLVARWSVIALSFAVQLGSYLGGYYQAQLHNQKEPPELAMLLAATTAPDDILLIFGQDWDSKTAYFANRRAVMVTDRKIEDLPSVQNVIERIDPRRITALVITKRPLDYQSRIGPFLAQLGLTPTPVFASNTTLVYLAERTLPRILTQVDPAEFKTFSVADNSVMDAGSTLVRRRSLASSIDPAVVQMLIPNPSLIIHPFGLAVTQEGDRNVFGAHAPTDIVFNRPATAHEVYAEFGMSPATYEPKNHTDGVEFRVEWVTADGEHRTLSSVYLAPTDRPADRGEKQLRIPLPAGENGQVWLRTLPGPSGSIACDWAYWVKAELR